MPCSSANRRSSARAESGKTSAGRAAAVHGAIATVPATIRSPIARRARGSGNPQGLDAGTVSLYKNSAPREAVP
jgi:hypothetical protein